jgi:hypothetical protein
LRSRQSRLSPVKRAKITNKYLQVKNQPESMTGACLFLERLDK